MRPLRAILAAATLVAVLALPAATHGERGESQSRKVVQGFAAGGDFTCVILDEGVVRCWGDNLNGQLGVGDTQARGDGPGEMPTPAVPLARPAVALSANFENACALLDDGAVRCWGANDAGQLGIGATDRRGDNPNELPTPAVPLGRPAVATATGTKHSCALLDEGSVRCWGGGSFGRLGTGDVDARGDDPGEPPAPPVPLGRPAVAVAAGFNHTCALLDDGNVHCWGDSSSGELGIGVNTARGDQPGELPTPAVPLGRPAVAISARATNSCALLDDASVKCWGSNTFGGLGIGATDPRGDQPGELPTPSVPLGRPAVAVSAGAGHNCALLDDGSVRCWGLGGSGRLGQGDSSSRGDQPGELPTAPVPLSRPASAVSAAQNHNCAVLDDGTVQCWGENDGGHLGNGSTGDLGDAAGELPSPFVPLGGRVRRAGDLSLAAGASDATREVGQQVTLTYTLANTGPDRIAGIVVGIGLPGMTIDSASTAQGSFDAASQSWRVGGVDPGGVAVLSVVATVRAPGTLTASGEVIDADTLDNDSTPGNGAAEDDRAGVEITATNPPAPVPPPTPEPAKGAIDALTLKAKVKRDRRSPYAYAVTGAVVATRTALAGACSGTVTVNVTKGKTKTTSAKGKLKLSKKAGTCTYKATIKLPKKAKAGNYTAVATFPGNAAVAAKNSKKLALRAG